MRVCSRCGRESPEEYSFCGHCGALLAEELQETRKTVTVVFSDVVGSTEIGERLDPESVRAVMKRYFEWMREVLERHGGTVEKFIGDAVVAVFGVPVTHEDDALRAVRASAEMEMALASLNKELERDHGFQIRTRTGVNTGEVVAGDAATRESFATGDAVNVAARLEQAAAPGEVLIGAPTHRLVKDAVQVEPVEPLTLKGKSEPLTAYRLLGVAAAVSGLARRLDTPIVGRNDELRSLERAFDRAVAEGHCRLVTVIAPAGVGKSRLVAEIQVRLRDRASLLRGRCLPYGEGITFWPVAEAVREAAEIEETDEASAAVGKVQRLLGDEPDAQGIVERVAAVLGLVETSPPVVEVMWAVRKLIESLARRTPVVMVIEDIHWAENTLLDLIEHVVDLGSAPILIVCPARPDLLESRADWGRGRERVATLTLEPLTMDQSGLLIEQLLGSARLPDSAMERVTSIAEGNPLFVEEIVAMLIDDGLIRRKDGDWVGTRDLTDVAIPPSLDALITARLDRLASEERAVIERGAVVGRVFYRGAVADLVSPEVRVGLDGHLSALVRKAMIREEPGGFAGEAAYRFHHILIREAAYAGIPKRIRADLHEAFSRWLERVAGARVREYEEILGHHLEQAYRYQAELGPVRGSAHDLAARAGRYLIAAGRRAFARGDASAAVNLLERAVSLWPPEEPERPALLLDLAEALVDAGEPDRARQEFDEALAAARAAGNRSVELRTSIARLSNSLGRTSEIDTEAVEEEARRAIREFEALGDQLGLSKAWALLADTESFRARYDSDSEALATALMHARKAGSERDVAVLSRREASDLLWGVTPVEEGIRRCHEVLPQVRGTPMVEGAWLRSLGLFEAMRGQFPEARRLLDRSRAIMLELGMRSWVAAGLGEPGGTVEMLAGDPAAAERILRQSVEVLREAGENAYLGTISVNLARALVLQGRDDEAEEFLEETDRLTSPDDIDARAQLLGLQARVLAKKGAAKEALSLAARAVTVMEGTHMLNEQGLVFEDVAEVRRLAGDDDGTEAALESAMERYQRKGNVVATDRVRILLGELSASGG